MAVRKTTQVRHFQFFGVYEKTTFPAALKHRLRNNITSSTVYDKSERRNLLQTKEFRLIKGGGVRQRSLQLL